MFNQNRNYIGQHNKHQLTRCARWENYTVAFRYAHKVGLFQERGKVVVYTLFTIGRRLNTRYGCLQCTVNQSDLLSQVIC
jgi:nitrate reductase cytochrome c-type subunit